MRAHALRVPVFVALIAAAFVFAGCRALVKGEGDFRRGEFLAYWYGPESNFLADEKLENAARTIIASERERDTMRLNNLAVAYVRLVRLEKAAATFRECLKRKPLVPRPYLNFAELQRLLGREERARAILREMAERPEFGADLLLKIAGAAEGEGGPEIGVMLAETVYARSGASTGASNGGSDIRRRSALWLGRYYLGVPDYARARTWLDRVLALDPKEKDALYGMGSIAYLAGDHETAIEYLEGALTNGGTQKPLRFLLAESLRKKDRIDRALKVLASTPGESMRNNFRLLELRGRLLLLKDWRTAPDRLLRGVQSPRMRERLLRSWFGDSNPDDIRGTRRELELMY